MNASISRIYIIDEIRGLCVFCMVFYHAFFTVSYVLNVKIAWDLLIFFSPIEPLFAGMFVLISGFCSNLSRSNIRRGIKLLIISLLLTLITTIFVFDIRINFGILHLLSISMIFVGLLERLVKNLSSVFGIIMSFILFCISYHIPDRYIGFLSLKFIEIPENFYKYDFLFPLGLPSANFFSSDYFPLIPWIFLFIAGFFIGKVVNLYGIPKSFNKNKIKFLSCLGENSLIIYLVHQPVIYFVCILLFRFFD